MSKIDLKQWVTANGRYPEREKSPELTEAVLAKAKYLLIRVNALLDELSIEVRDCTSGFRTSAANSSTPNSAKRSAHMTGEAVDIMDDKKQSLAKKITVKLLEKYDLYMEDPKYTIGKNTNWVHLQTRRTASGNRVFRP
jgi:hypothetical protein